MNHIFHSLNVSSDFPLSHRAFLWTWKRAVLLQPNTIFSSSAQRPSGSNMPSHSVSRPLSVTSAGWGGLRDVCLPFMCDALGKKRPWRPLQLRSKSPILNANLVGFDYPCLELLSKQAVIQIRVHLLWWVGFHRGDRCPCWDRGETWEEECGLLHMLPTIRKQFFSFMSRSKLVRQHMCWPWVLALQGMHPPTPTCHRKVRMEKLGYRGRDQIHIWTQGRVEEKIQTERNRQNWAKFCEPLNQQQHSFHMAQEKVTEAFNINYFAFLFITIISIKGSVHSTMKNLSFFSGRQKDTF